MARAGRVTVLQGLTPAFTPHFGAAGFRYMIPQSAAIRAFVGIAGNPENPRIPILAKARRHIAPAAVSI